MRTYDLTPLLRSSIGFDRMSRLLDSATQIDARAKSYPPYNIVRTDDDQYRITLAVAGFSEGDLNIETQNNRLTVSGDSGGVPENVEFLHRGIAGRSFERTFQLADHIRVLGAHLENGLLHIELERVVPEALKPRTIAITSTLDAAAAK